MKNSEYKFYCECCDYKCNKKQYWTQHIKTKKHKRKHLETEKIFECEICNIRYSSRSGLWKHKQKKHTECKIVVADETPQMKEMMEMMKKLMTENEKLTELVKKMPGEMPPSVNLNNTNSNQYYINVFLNEICKDAMNINDFVKSLMIGVDELELAKTKGLAEGVSSLMVNGLNKLEISQRPIHCTDARRKTLYIKNDDKWDKDNKEVIDSTLTDIHKKHTLAIKKWQEDHPGWETDDELIMEFMGFVKSINLIMDKNQKNKITKQLSKNTLIDVEEIKDMVDETT